MELLSLKSSDFLLTKRKEMKELKDKEFSEFFFLEQRK